VPAKITVTEAFVSPVLHNNFPGAVIDNVEELQLLTTVIAGITGIALGAAIADEALLGHPLTVCIKV
jgi:hypothetical protein